ncbi:MAG TPA: hypothetical protein VEH08_07000 [Methanomassiliicoccales archaeon]|nr:hypothetical protein [Methanomassiliicoccales archaeon]HXZ24468.1 hypothetical protein [Methanomassiliicoccales archaeon]
MRRILVCPQCGSTSIFYEAGGITGQIYHCQKCDYIGSVILEQEVDETEFPEPPKPEKTERKRRNWFKRRNGE